MEAAPENEGLSESLKLRFGRGQSIVKVRYFLLEHPLGSVALLGKGIKSVREPIVELRQNRDLFSEDRFYVCISRRRWHLFRKSSTRS